MKSLMICMLCFGAMVTTSCGYNPTTVGEERDRSDERRKEAEQENTRLKNELTVLKKNVGTAFFTENSYWFLGADVADYEEAYLACKDLGMSLPTQEQHDELIAAKPELADRKEDDSFKLPVHILLKSVTLRNGFGFCRRDIN